ncbi:hypothetical protein WN51_02247 [Melipona quadrifasciata]|uniref:Uncharacterized protein n=1 Tax=Melipona quadrifasciata TaxID=166423 RepID=A0A0M8ZW52_9HYME|nr:hypothetical protein WN51_02247 [Melipona quadrifasciata]
MDTSEQRKTQNRFGLRGRLAIDRGFEFPVRNSSRLISCFRGSFAVEASAVMGNFPATFEQHLRDWYQVRCASILDLKGSTEIKKVVLSDGTKAESLPGHFHGRIENGPRGRQRTVMEEGRVFEELGRSDEAEGTRDTSLDARIRAANERTGTVKEEKRRWNQTNKLTDNEERGTDKMKEKESGDLVEDRERQGNGEQSGEAEWRSRVAKQSGEAEHGRRGIEGEGGVKGRGTDDVIVEGCPGNGEAKSGIYKEDAKNQEVSHEKHGKAIAEIIEQNTKNRCAKNRKYEIRKRQRDSNKLNERKQNNNNNPCVGDSNN